MPSSYTDSLRLVLPVTGELTGTWGDTVNVGLTALLDAAVAGTAAVAHDDSANYTLTSNNGAADEARRMFLNVTGTLTAARNVVCPTASKLYFIKNATTGGFALTLKTSAGTGISVPNGKSMVLRCDGTNVVEAVDQINALTVASLVAATADINGGTIDSAAINATTVGASTPSTGAFTTLAASGAFSLAGDQVQVSEGGTGATTTTQAKINLESITAATGSQILPVGTTAQRDGSPTSGYLRFNSTLSKPEIYNGSAWGSVGGGATGGGADEVFIENGQTVSADYTIPVGKNAMSTGPITVDDGVVVTISSGSRWVVI